jgi:hypothetical protein
MMFVNEYFQKKGFISFNRVAETIFWDSLQCRNLIWLMEFIKQIHICLEVIYIERNKSYIRVLIWDLLVFHHWTITQASHSVLVTFILILSFHMYLSISDDLLPSALQATNMSVFISFPKHTVCPAGLFIWYYEVPHVIFLHLHFFSSLVSQNIHLSISYYRTIFCIPSSWEMRDECYRNRVWGGGVDWIHVALVMVFTCKTTGQVTGFVYRIEVSL